jgi:DNA-binding NtrC family response regulator
VSISRQMPSVLRGHRRSTLVYVFENDATLRSVLVEVLMDEGFAIQDFDSIDALHEASRGQRPSLIVADGWGPSYTELTSEERTEIADLSSLAPLVLITGRAWGSTVTAEELGVLCILPKPIELTQFVAQVQQCLEQTT